MYSSIDITSLFLQLYNLVLLMQDYKNTDLMQELQKQDSEYLEKIIEQNKEIINLLRREGKHMEEKVIKKVEEKIKEIIDDDITPQNVDNLYKLSKIKHMAKEDEAMNYGNYYGNNYGNYGGRRTGYDSYGRDSYGNYGENSYGENYGRGNYGRRGVDSKYRGEEQLDRVHNEYGRYMESRSRYGAGEETDKSFHYMVKSLEDFVKYLFEDAENEQQKQMLRETLQRSMM